MSPLGRLYRTEYARLRARFPDQDPLEQDRYILLIFALAFLDADAEELAQAMVEGTAGDGSPRGTVFPSTARESAERAIAQARKTMDTP